MAPMAKKFLHCCIIDREGLGGFELVFEPSTHLPDFCYEVHCLHLRSMLGTALLAVYHH